MSDHGTALASAYALCVEVALTQERQRSAVAALAAGRPCDDDVDMLAAQTTALLD